MATKIDANAIREVADNIGKIMDEHKATFESVKYHWPNAGQPDKCVSVERLVDDRRNAIVAHADHLMLTFETMSAKLKAVADKFEETDGNNATEIKNLIDGLEGEISGKIISFDQETEKEQQNYSGPGTNGDGDGWNDNLMQSVSGTTEETTPKEDPNNPQEGYQGDPQKQNQYTNKTNNTTEVGR
ncbi:hypothetical protein [Amycolatopsis japonica]